MTSASWALGDVLTIGSQRGTSGGCGRPEELCELFHEVTWTSVYKGGTAGGERVAGRDGTGTRGRTTGRTRGKARCMAAGPPRVSVLHCQSRLKASLTFS